MVLISPLDCSPRNQYLVYNEYVNEPAGVRRLDFFINCIKEYQLSYGLMPKNVEILDMGCGNGNITISLAGFDYNILGVDSDPDSIKNAKSKNIFPNAEFKNCSADKLSKDRRFDVVILSEVVEHLDNPAEILKLTKQLLKSDGMLLVSIPNGRSVEELIRRFTSSSNAGKAIKLLVRKYIVKKENIQSMADSPHLHFFKLSTFQGLLSECGFKVVLKSNGSVFFKEMFYILFRLFIKRGSKTFFILDHMDNVLSEILPISFGNSWLFKIIRTSSIEMPHDN